MYPLSELQKEIVLSNDPITMVIAGPGSGKTRVLTYKVAHLINEGADPSSILLLTFTKKAAKNMMERIDQILNKQVDLLGGTFHHVANLFIRRYADYLGYPKNYSIIDTQDSQSLIRSIIKEEFSEFKDDLPKAEVLHKIFSYCTNSGLPVTEYLSNFRPEFSSMSRVIVQIREAYAKRKKEMHFMDFDDLLFNFLKLLDNEDIRKKITTQYKHIFVDEFQDTNRVQYLILKKLYTPYSTIFVVGDDSQSIYSFRAAEIKNMFRFKEDFPSVKIYLLSENFRSAPPIVHVINEIIKNNRIKFDKVLHPVKESQFEQPELIYFDSARDESEYVAERIEALLEKGVSPKEIAVLYRSNYLSAYLETELMRRGIKYVKLGGLRFFETAHVKDVIAFLKVVEGVNDPLAWERFLKLFDGVGEQTAKSTWAKIKSSSNLLSEFFLLRHKKMKAVYDVLTKIPKDASLSDKVQKFLREFYFYYLQDKYPDSLEDRFEDLNQLSAFLGYYENLDEFLEDAMLDMDIVHREEDGDRVTLSTVHQAKGLEWDHVFVIGLAQGRFPSKHALEDDERIEEERRLFYVACSRASKTLTLTVPLSDNTAWDYRLDLKPSKFVKEIDEGLLKVWNHFDKPRPTTRKGWGSGSLFQRADELI